MGVRSDGTGEEAPAWGQVALRVGGAAGTMTRG